MTDRKISKAEWAAMCRTLDSAPRKKFNVGALMRSAADHVIADGTLSVRFPYQSNRERLADELKDSRCRAAVHLAIRQHCGTSLNIAPQLVQIKDYYVGIIKQMIDEQGLQVKRSTHQISVQGTAAEVLWYTNWYVAGDDQLSWRRLNRYYRYSRYIDVLTQLRRHGVAQQIAHVDIGCGPGLFSWVVLDWARQRNLRYSNILLYGYDYSTEMINLAQEIQRRLRTYVRDIPKIEYYHDRSALFSGLASSRQLHCDYLITFGYVLAGNHEDDAIKSYVEAINYVLDLTSHDRNCILAFSDANYQGNFRRGWDKLMMALDDYCIASREINIETGTTSDRCVVLSRREV